MVNIVLARWLYCLVLYLAVPLVWLRLILRTRKQPAYGEYRWERWGFYPAKSASKPLIWVHAVSVGETRAAEPLILALLKNYPDHDILLTGMTPTGRAAGLECFGTGTQTAGRVFQAYLPYDYPGAVSRFLRHFQPRLGLLMETELWPNLMASCSQRKIPVALVNARLSERSARGYQRFSALTQPAFQKLACVAAQTGADASRLRASGAPNVTVCGNLKFDVTPAPEKLALGKEWRKQIGLSCGLRSRPVWLAASTREGEEADLLAEHRAILAQRPDALCILVPRHPQRFAAVAALATESGLKVAHRNQQLPATDTQVWLGDSMGEMAAYYAASDIAIIGGSWQPLGGQNLIEAAACGCPVVVGPHTFNFTQATADAIAANAAIRLADTSAIAPTLLSFWTQPEQQATMRSAAEKFTAQHQGATQRILATIVGIIPPLH
jgi:3-deoxy-D-manno-octulosonic-acid transferase